MSSTVQPSAETYGQMANMSSGSCGSSFLNNSNNQAQMRSSFRDEPVEFIDDREDSSDAAVYNFPWDVKNKASQLLLQSAQATLESTKSMTKPQQSQQPPPVPQCPPPSTLTMPTKAVQEEDDETQYCAPWDLKLQEEMFKKMSESKKANDNSVHNKSSPKANDESNGAVNRSHNDSISNGQNNTSLTNNSLTKSSNNTNNNHSELNNSIKSNKSTTDLNGTKPSVQPPSYEEANEYSPPWELKQSSLMQSIQSQNGLKPIASTASINNNMSAPLSTSSTASTLTNATTTTTTNTNNQANPSALSTLFNQFSRTRLSTRSNTSSSSSTRSSTSSLSASSPPSIPAPPSIPPPPPPMSASSVSRCNSTCSQSHIIQQSPRLPHRHLSHQSSASNLPGNSNNGLLMSRNSNMNSSLTHQCSSCSLSKKTGMSSANGHSCMHHQQQQQFPNTLLTHSSYLNESKFCSWGSSTGSSSNTNSFDINNCASSIDVDPKTFSRQSRTGSNHHFAYPSITNQFQTSSMQMPCSMNVNDFKTMQIQAIPVTALFSQNSLPANMMPLNVQHQTVNNHQAPPLVSPASMNHLLLLERQIWFHGKITRKQAENRLENRSIGSFLIRQSESGNANDFSLSLIGSGVVHMRISIKNGEYILGQCSQPFNSIVKMVEHYGKVEVPIKGALHVRLTNPVAKSC